MNGVLRSLLDLLVLNPEIPSWVKIPEYVRIRLAPLTYNVYSMYSRNAFKLCLKKLRVDLLLRRTIAKNGLEAAIKAVPHLIHARLFKPIKVWGSGFLTEPRFVRPFVKKRLDVYALRGKLTHRYLAKYGFVDANAAIPYGDPGLLYAELFGIKKDTQYDLGVIPHVRDAEAGRAIAESYSKKGLKVNLIDASQTPSVVVGEIAKCEKVLSSSLHGLIVSDSLGIPNRHLVLSTLGHSKDDFYLKFKDYYSAFGEELPSEEDYTVRDKGKLHELKSMLRSAFPSFGAM